MVGRGHLQGKLAAGGKAADGGRKNGEGDVAALRNGDGVRHRHERQSAELRLNPALIGVVNGITAVREDKVAAAGNLERTQAGGSQGDGKGQTVSVPIVNSEGGE